MPSIGMSVGGRFVARSPRVKATAIGAGESLCDRDEREPAGVGDRPHPLNGVAAGDAHAGSRTPPSRRAAGGALPVSVCGSCQRSSAATYQPQRRRAVMRLDDTGVA